ncbi:hypothetical protein F383_34456 [Gossypium arboreum]|uniref:Uncharacterized protein n=1 Tax=Gossypium arboreum TaxID=29729 RepID=A0A0B0PTB4_GOSAR|nr:hypothetical protein F383_34456 [Gossypium arboreum]
MCAFWIYPGRVTRLGSEFSLDWYFRSELIKA